MKIQEKSGQFFMTIPRAIMTLKDWEKGDNLQIKEDKKGNLPLVREVKTI